MNDVPDVWDAAKVAFEGEGSAGLMGDGGRVGTFCPPHSLCIKETDWRRHLNS